MLLGKVTEPLRVGFIEVDFQVFSGCGQLGRFIVTEDGNTSTIEIEAAYIGCVCTLDAPIRTVIYEFSATNPGVYELKFKSGTSEYITVNLIID